MIPRYACVILRIADGRFVLEQRPPEARHAAGQWTCFGGKREPGETLEETARRELREELGIDAGALGALGPGVDLFVAGEHVAHFFVAATPIDPATLRPEPHHPIALADAGELDERPLSTWHRAVLRAFLDSRSRADVPV